MIALFLPAWAQDEAALDALDATTFRPTVAGRAGWWATDAGQLDAGASGRAVVGYQRDPLVAQDDAGEFRSVLQDVVGFDLQAAWSWQHLRVGVDLPIVAYAGSDVDVAQTGLGNAALELHGIALPTGGPVGVAGQVRLLVPGTITGPLGSEGFGGEVLAIVDHDFGPALLVANVGARFGEESALPNVEVGDAGLWRVGGAFDLVENGSGLSVDLGGQLSLADPGNVAANPIEAIGGGWGRVSPELVVRAGVGRALTPGVGAPNVRALVSVSLERPLDDDRDDDQVVDRDDACRDVPEDPDGWQDDDGCPEATTEVVVLVVDADNRPVPAAAIDACGTLAGVGQPIVLSAGDCALSIRADGYDPDQHVLAVVDGPPVTVTRVLKLTPPPRGSVKLTVTDFEKHPLDGEWAISRERRGFDDPRPFTAGTAIAELEPGVWNLRVASDGYMPTTFPVEVSGGQVTESVVQLRPVKVKVTREKVEITDKIYFDTGKATIQSRSFGLLDDVAEVLAQRPEIVSVRIEGHTDSRGSDAANLELSANRARAVLDYLVRKGIEARRLESQGFGETRPVDARATAAAWELNRRVEFVITGWSG